MCFNPGTYVLIKVYMVEANGFVPYLTTNKYTPTNRQMQPSTVVNSNIYHTFHYTTNSTAPQHCCTNQIKKNILGSISKLSNSKKLQHYVDTS